MPAPIKYYNRDPNGLGRGGGLYYRRGPQYKGKRYQGGYYSKYTQSIDRHRKSHGFRIHPVGTPNKSRIPHTSDGRLPG